MSLSRFIRALNLPALAAVSAFIWTIFKLALALEPFAMTGAVS